MVQKRSRRKRRRTAVEELPNAGTTEAGTKTCGRRFTPRPQHSRLMKAWEPFPFLKRATLFQKKRKDHSMNILLIYPEFPDTFWSYKHALKFVGKRAALPPLGLITVAAMLPSH
jgi:hypothetical protein